MIKNKQKTIKKDVCQEFTDKIITAIENGKVNDWVMPWHSSESLEIPVNISSKKAYRGANILSLWISSITHSYTSNLWGTYQQWKAKGGQVKKGETSTEVIFWKITELEQEADETEVDEKTGTKKLFIARSYSVFNACQVSGYEQPKPVEPQAFKNNQVKDAFNFFYSLPGTVLEQGNRAFYKPDCDLIVIPPLSSFKNVLNYLGVLGHEYIHWTGLPSRLNRDLSGRFGSDAYAIEELIAELGAAFISAFLGLITEPREENISYIDSWLKVLKSDKKAIFMASSKAQQATDSLIWQVLDIEPVQSLVA